MWWVDFKFWLDLFYSEEQQVKDKGELEAGKEVTQRDHSHYGLKTDEYSFHSLYMITTGKKKKSFWVQVLEFKYYCCLWVGIEK